MLRIFLFFYLVLFCSVLNAAGWWNGDWRYRRLVKVTQLPRHTDWVAARFILCTDIKPDGSDIRVVDENNDEVPFYVVWAEPYSFAEVMFKAKRGIDTYYIYYGNPNAPKVKTKRPKVGLIMETRERPPGPCDSWRDFQKLLKKSKKVYGRILVSKIFHGYNPFGPSDNYITIYRGYLRCPEDGEYRIATNSDDSSFIFIDGKLLVSWPGMHGATGVWGEHNAKIKLKKGLHKIEYYHEEREGGQGCVAGWWKPGDKLVSLIPDWAYPAPAKATVGLLQQIGSRMRGDIKVVPLSEIQTQDRALLVEVKFKAHVRSKSEEFTYKWDFGDGITSTEPSPTHIFCTPGTYTVTLEVSDGKEKFEAKFTHYIGFLFFYKDTASKRRYLDIIRTYPLGKMSVEALMSIASFAELVEDDLFRLRVLEELIKRKEKIHLRRLLIYLRDAGRLYIEVRRDFDRAVESFRTIEELTRQPWWVSQAALGVADAHFYLKRDLDTAKRMYEALFKEFRRLSPGYAKLARIRTGDILRLKGEFKKAEEVYRSAKEMTSRIYRTDEEVRRGEFILSASNYIERRLFKKAMKELEEWEWQLPEDKLTSEFSIIRARALFAQKRYEDAALELQGFIKVNEAKDCPKKASAYPDALYALAVVFAKLGEKEKARELLNSLMNEHKEAEELLKKAEELLRSLRK